MARAVLRRLQHIGVERARLFDGGEMRVGEFGRGNLLRAQPVARRGQRERGQIGHPAVGSSQENGFFSAFAGALVARLPAAAGCAGSGCTGNAAEQRLGRRRVVRLQQAPAFEVGEPDGIFFTGEAHASTLYSTTFGTRKK